MVVTATGDATQDFSTLNAAISAAAPGDTIQLQNASSGAGANGFALPTDSGFWITKSLTFQGLPVNGAMPRVSGGAGAAGAQFRVYGAIDVAFYDIEFAQFTVTAIFIGRVDNLVVQGCRFTSTQTALSSGNNVFGTGQFRFGVLASSIDGGSTVLETALIDDNTMDFLTDGGRPADSNLFIEGVSIHWAGPDSRTWITNNTIDNVTFSGVNEHNCLGAMVIASNTINMTPWAALDADGTYLNGNGWSSCRGIAVWELGERPNPLNQGSFLIEDNQVTSLQPDGDFIELLNFQGSSQEVAVRRNRLTANADPAQASRFGVLDWGHSFVDIGQNKLSGRLQDGLVLGFDDAPVFDTHGCALTANDLSQADYLGAALVFGASAHDNVAVGGGGSRETVLDIGTNNRVTGYGPVMGGVGATIQAAMQAARAAVQAISGGPTVTHH
jgi:hypothetical protein